MSKAEFLGELERKLSRLPQEEREERIAFYREMIEDQMEDGAPEEEAVSQIGSVDTVVGQILSEVPLTLIVKEVVKPKRNLKAWEIVLLVLGSPVWIPLLLAAAAVILSVYVVIWSIVICIWAADLSLATGALAGLAGVVVYLRAGNPAGAAYSVGAGLACAGLAILLFFACLWITKTVVKLTGRILLGIKTSFVGKEE